MAVSLKFNTGATITLRPTMAKSGTTQYLAARPASVPYIGHFGVNVDIALLGGKLPTGNAEVFVDDKKVGTIELEQGVTQPSPTTGKGGGKPKVTGKDGVDVEFDGTTQSLKIERISQPKTGQANILIRSSRPRVHSEL